jgi:cation diffusion facilitator CzcD-associated flavoprotein CzcO
MPVANYQQYQYLHGVNDSTDFVVSELIDHHSTDHSKPRVLIAGAGLGGLTLAILLKKAGIPFEIFERQEELKPLGNHTLSLSPFLRVRSIVVLCTHSEHLPFFFSQSRESHSSFFSHPQLI